MPTPAVAAATKTAAVEASAASKAPAMGPSATKTAAAETAARATPEGVISPTTETATKGPGRRV